MGMTVTEYISYTVPILLVALYSIGYGHYLYRRKEKGILGCYVLVFLVNISILGVMLYGKSM